jgi:hypothetical protein
MVNEIKAYQTGDGKVFATRAEAIAHEKSLLRVEALNAWAEEHLSSYDQLRSSEGLRRDDVVFAILKNLDSLVKALNL